VSGYLKSMTFRELSLSPSGETDMILVSPDGDRDSSRNVVLFKYPDAADSPRRFYCNF
jgi:hypothetical protein